MSNANLLQLIQAQGQINGRYGNLNPLGATATDNQFSMVLRAQQLTTNKPVALKFHDPNTEAYRRHSFDREGAVLSTILKDEELFVQLVDKPDSLRITGTFPGFGAYSVDFPFLAFEWLTGGDLRAFTTAPAGHRETLWG